MNSKMVCEMKSPMVLNVQDINLFVLVRRLKRFDIAKMNVNWQKVELTCRKRL